MLEGTLEPPVADIAADEPEAYIARDRRQALADRIEMPDRVVGSALFADISGFTPLTEALANELGPQRGAEELTANLGRVFHAVIAELDRHGGNVIYFSGDAITCWIDGDDGMRAVTVAFAMQDAMARVGEITTPAGTVVRLALKVAVATGRARRFVVGDPSIQLIDVLAGRLIDDLAETEHHADKGEVVLDHSVVESLGDRVVTGDVRTDAEGHGAWSVAVRLTEEPEPAPAPEPEPLDDELVRPWLLPAVYERMRSGRGEFLAELRPAYPVFLRFDGIDYDDDDDAIAKLDDFVRRAQQIMAGYGGNVLQLTLGDKGAYLYGVFGSPVAHEDDAARAAAAALELRDLERSTEARAIQIGLTRGRLRSGTYGHAMRRTFVCLGDAVNLAARLMSAAPTGHIYVDDRLRQEAGDAYIWEQLPDLSVKGKKGAIVAHQLTGSLERASRRKVRYQLELIGRRAELETLDRYLQAATAGDGRQVGIAAEAGMGKSRLIAEFVRKARRRGLFVAFGECQSFGTNTSYFVWREIARRLFGLDEGDAGPHDRAQVEAALTAIDPGLVERAPLLSTVLGIDLPDNDMTRTLDAKTRKASLEDLVATCLRARAEREPIVLVLEDCHWIDALSRDLLEVVSRAVADRPVLVVLAYRPAASPGGGLGIERLPGFSEFALAELETDESRQLIQAKLGQVLGLPSDAPISDALVDLVTERADGNPFYIEELVSFIAAQDVDPADPVALRDVQLPESLHSLVLSRIDTMAEEPRRTLKVASVVGRVFEARTLPGAYPELGDVDQVVEQLDVLRTVDLVTLDREADRAYLFKHVATQEVAYESLPFAVRSMLHGRIGRYLEDSRADSLDQHVDLLAHHFSRSDDDARKRLYLGSAADAARASYANAAAIDYLERLLPLLVGAERVDRAVELAQVLQLIGATPQAEAVVIEARREAEALGDPRLLARCDHSLAESARRVGRFDEAAQLLGQALVAFAEAGDRAGEADALQVTGTVAAQRGDPETAQARYLEGLTIREGLGDETGVAALTSNLGIVAQQLGDAAGARAYANRALDLYTHLGDRRRIGNCQVNLAWMDGMAGDHESARRRCEEAIRLAIEVGDRLNLGLAQNNLGDALRDLGRFEDAGEAYAEAVETYRDLGDLAPLMALFEDVAVLTLLRGDHRLAWTLVGASDGLRATLGAPRSAGAEANLVEEMSEARVALGDAEADAALGAGTALATGPAIQLVIDAARGDAGG